MRKTLTALLIAAALPTVALAATPAPTDAPPPAPYMKDHEHGMMRGERGVSLFMWLSTASVLWAWRRRNS